MASSKISFVPTTPKESRILVIEDNKGNQQIVAAYLGSAGYKNIVFANDGVEGLKAAKEQTPDLILLDIIMPNMDGYEVLTHLKADETLRGVPVLVQTALIKPEERSRIFKEGATDLVSKPLNGIELLSRIAIHLENKFLIRRLTAFQDRVEKELQLARDMQTRLLPSCQVIEDAEEKLHISISGHFEASSEVGGDLWGASVLDGNRLAVYIVDFAGHGVTAALNTFRLHTLMEGLDHKGGDPADYLSTLNQRLCALLPTEQYATMFYGVIDTAAETLTYAAAAPPAPIVGKGNSKDLVTGDPKGFPLGISKTAKYENRTEDFPPNSFLFLYSDALTESRDADGDAMGEDGAIALLKRHLAKTKGACPLEGMMSEFMDTAVTPIPDDLSAVFVRWRP